MNDALVPFLKWAGGKRWLAEDLAPSLQGAAGRYIEPFLGGAAVFFALNPQQAVLADTNEELINVYRQVRRAPKKFREALYGYQGRHSAKLYYQERDRGSEGNFDQAVRFVYLNRTCFNGIYRVNLRGKFNVPIGSKTKIALDTDDYPEASRRLKKAELLAQDFEETISMAKRGDVVYADPPYTVSHNDNGFLKYNDKIFQWEDQERLEAALSKAADRGARVVVSNADHPSIRELYGSWKMYQVGRASVISAASEARVKTSELVISNVELELPKAKRLK